MTAAATEFVRPLTFEALTKRPVLTSLWEGGRALAHVDLAKAPDAIVVAPATANIIARAAQGIADDFLSTLLLATDVPVLFAPGMNDDMYAHPATQVNLATIRNRGWTIVGPNIGPLAEGPSTRPGRMAEPEQILVHVERLLLRHGSKLEGKRVLVTAGPTREPLDPVRVISNAASGKMGFQVAERAFARGADVVLVTGPTALADPTGIETVPVTTTEELRTAVAERLPQSDVFVMAAAPADYRAAEPSMEKRPRESGGMDVTLVPTLDVLTSTLGQRRSDAVIVGFALEMGEGVERAREKLGRKRLDLIVLNPADEEGSGFEVDTNRVTLVTAEDARPLEQMTKKEVAERVLDEIEALL
jgi:phosphopantothenoylcysteine decarboxylase/phosphopantothenate--cysteine ligase